MHRSSLRPGKNNTSGVWCQDWVVPNCFCDRGRPFPIHRLGERYSITPILAKRERANSLLRREMLEKKLLRQWTKISFQKTFPKILFEHFEKKCQKTQLKGFKPKWGSKCSLKGGSRKSPNKSIQILKCFKNTLCWGKVVSPKGKEFNFYFLHLRGKTTFWIMK